MRRSLSSALACLTLFTAGCAAKAPAAAPKTTAPTASASASATAEADHARVVKAAVEGLTSARTAYRWEVGRPGDRAYAVTGKGGHDFRQKRGTLVVGIEDAARFEQVFTPERLYLRGGTKLESADWTFVDRSEMKAERLLKAPGNDPEFLLRQAVRAERYQRVGKEDLAGTSATRYRGELTHAALTLNMSADARKKVDQMRDMLGGAIPATADVWIDGRGRLAQVRLEMIIEGVIESTTTLTLTGQGEPVKVRVPAGAVAGAPSSLV
ncbi:hypothetical protein [Streptomyces sp. NPDC094032]|uniref:hypothetical protein n=1 Tax=Streptomyces sp. NPDC094032 TaxID=3155308 RepID=UPI00332FD840